MQYLKNDSLPIIKSDWKGNPFSKKEFQYPNNPFFPDWSNVWKMMRTPNPQRKEKRSDKWRLTIHEGKEYLQNKKPGIVWYGHACFLIQLGGIRMITDPVLGKLPMVPRFAYLPFPTKEITGLDYILLSHDHRDHCDKSTLKKLLSSNQPKKILTALKISNVIKRWVGDTFIEEAGWYQQYDTSDTDSELEIIFLPTMHWCRRGLNDFNRTLWGSFIIRDGATTIYFGGDSGSGEHYAEIAQLFPQIDYAILGIGAYKPDFMMKRIHTSPEDATEAFLQLGAQKLIPMHYGTMDLSNEPISEPYNEIQRIFEEKGMRDRLVMAEVNQFISLV